MGGREDKIGEKNLRVAFVDLWSVSHADMPTQGIAYQKSTHCGYEQ